VELTTRQQEIVEAQGDFLLLACPGSGKTRAASHRVARLVSEPGMKVAVCSYTNIGAERIGAMLGEIGVVLDHEHFLGTIHGYLLRYIVYPFAHLLGATQGPFIREGGNWPEVVVHGDPRQRMALDMFRRSPDGSLVVSSKPRSVAGTDEEIIGSVGAEVLRRKSALFEKAGVLTADDAMWAALSILRDHPAMVRAAAGRFNELLLDEAQDTSALQLACLETLHQAGRLASLVMIGDLEQSIYSFQGASAAGCTQLADRCGLRTELLTENHRCSQQICDVAIHFCARDTADIAVGPHAACEIHPEVALYPPTDPRAAVTAFRERLDHHGISLEAATVLARRWKVVNALNGQTAIFEEHHHQYVVGQLASRLEAGTLTASDFRRTQRLLAYSAWNVHNLDELTDDQRQRVRVAAYAFLESLPVLQGNLRQWLQNSGRVLQATATTLTDDVRHTGGRMLRAGSALEAHDAADVFAPVPTDLHARTVHSFKGEDSDAIMLVVQRPHGNDPTSQLELWEAAVAGTGVPPGKEEENRVLFVALTRARRFCLVALPDNARGQAVANTCAQLGFVVH
jgi:DNA helicase-2/ATP-dependent DNA helicase PcrA